MKIISWNCNGGFRKKFEQISKLDADIYIIQECEDPARTKHGSYNNWCQNYLWIGDNKNKGIGIFAKTNIALEKLEWDDDGLQLFLPCRINDQFNLLGVWTKQANSPTFKYIGQFWKYLQKHNQRFVEDEILIAGDFNSNVQWDVWDRWWNHSDVVRELEELHIKSLYHDHTGEEQGNETYPTFFMYRKTEKPYHIDYMFGSKLFYDTITGLKIGPENDWVGISDHLPLEILM